MADSRRGEVGEVWLARLLPPASGRFGYHVVATTPCIVRGSPEGVWLAYIEGERRRIGTRTPVRNIDATGCIMKRGPSGTRTPSVPMPGTARKRSS
jgi:hypothetical protein